MFLHHPSSPALPRAITNCLLTALAFCLHAAAANTARPCDLNVPSPYAKISDAVTAATNNQVICVAAGVYSEGLFELATKSLTLQGPQAGVDARKRAARRWAKGDAYPADEAVFTYTGVKFFGITGGLGATVDGIFMPNIGARALDQSAENSAVVSLTIKNSILKSTDSYTENQNGIVQFAAHGTASANNVVIEQNYIETFTRTFLYASSDSTKCNNWVIRDNEIRSYYFAFGPFAGNDANGYPSGMTIQGNLFSGDIPGSPPSRQSSPDGYDGYAFNGILGNAVITGNTFTKLIRGLGDVWLYDAVVQGNTFDDNYVCAMALRNSDASNPTPKPPSSNVQIKNNIINYNGTPINANGDTANFLSQGIWINRPSGGVTPVNAATLDITDNHLKNLGTGSDATQVWAIRQDGANSANAIGNYWGASPPSDIRVSGSAAVSPWINSYGDNPNKAGDPGFWPINIVYGAPVGEPTLTPTGADVTVDFQPAGGGTESVGTITFGEVTEAGTTVVIPVAPNPSDTLYVAPSNFLLGNPPVYYDIATTAQFTGNIKICLVYPADSIPAGNLPSLYHYSAGTWVDITTSRDTDTRTVCGLTQSLSPFALGYVVPPPPYSCKSHGKKPKNTCSGYTKDAAAECKSLPRSLPNRKAVCNQLTRDAKAQVARCNAPCKRKHGHKRPNNKRGFYL